MSNPTHPLAQDRNRSADIPPLAEVSAHILAVLKEHGALTGTALATAIRKRFPSFEYKTYGVFRLKEFLAMYASPDVVIVGRQGLDILIDAKSSQNPPVETATKTDTPAAGLSGPAISEETNVYRAFTSPNSAEAVTIEVNRKTGAWRSVAPGTPVQPEWAAIRPLGADEHREIAKQFLATQGDDVRELLSEIIEDPSRNWWLRLRAVLHTNRQADESFAEFRLKAIRERLRNVLSENGVELGAIPTAIEKATARALRSRRQTSLGLSPKALIETFRAQKFDSFQQLALQILAALPESELRDLRVRLGDVYTALRD